MKPFGTPQKIFFTQRNFGQDMQQKHYVHIFEYVIINIKETKNIKGILVLKTVHEFLSL